VSFNILRQDERSSDQCSPYNALPGFQATFTTFTPQISFNLHTSFLCTQQIDPEETKSEDETLDAEWEEWRLPSLKRKQRSNMPSFLSSMDHTGGMSIKIVRPSSVDPARQALLKHYSDPTAKAPLLSTQILSKPIMLKDESTLVLVGLENRDEGEQELKQWRYDLWSSGRQRQPRCRRGENEGGCWNLNNGGGGMHAAKLWQRFEREKEMKRSKGGKEGLPHRQASASGLGSGGGEQLILDTAGVV
jgi:hypothetical protein